MKTFFKKMCFEIEENAMDFIQILRKRNTGNPNWAERLLIRLTHKLIKLVIKLRPEDFFLGRNPENYISFRALHYHELSMPRREPENYIKFKDIK